MGKFGFKNLFGKSKDFFDKEATIKEYFAIVPPEKRKKCETYDELYEEALKFVSKQDFNDNTADQDDYFHELSNKEGGAAVFIGLVAFLVGAFLDYKGTDIEKAIDAAVKKVFGSKYDTNNAFDVKQGKGHRVFGHDVFTFGVRNIPGDALIKVNNKAVKIGDFLGVGTQGKVRMWDLIWKFYGEDKNSSLRGVMSCLSHTIVHFSKDIFTPDGLPLPFSSLFEKYELNDVIIDGELDKASLLYYKDSVMKQTHRLNLELKASDLASMIIIETLIGAYANSQKNKLGDKTKELKNDTKLIAMGTCIALQMATVLTLGELRTTGSSSVPGGKANAIMIGAFMRLTIQEMTDIAKARISINKAYQSDYMRGYYNGNN